MSQNDEAPSESATDPHAQAMSVWRARFMLSIFAGLSLVLLFLAILAGLVEHELRDTPSYMKLEKPLSTFNELMWFLEPIHNFAAYGLMVLMPMGGYYMYKLGSRLSVGSAKWFKIIGLVTAVSAIIAAIAALVTGSLVGDPVTFAHVPGSLSGMAQTDAFADDAGRQQTHLQLTAAAMLVPALGILAGAVLSSLPSVKREAGIRAKAK